MRQLRRILLLAVALPALLVPAAPATAPKRSATVTIIDNAYVRGMHRPEVVIRRNGVVTWRWRSRQSHNVEAVSGPERFRSKIKVGGRYSHRFRRLGTYRIVCALHAPGMKMRVRVVR